MIEGERDVGERGHRFTDAASVAQIFTDPQSPLVEGARFGRAVLVQEHPRDHAEALADADPIGFAVEDIERFGGRVQGEHVFAPLVGGERQIVEDLAVDEAGLELAVHVDGASELAERFAGVALAQREQAERVVGVGEPARILKLREGFASALVAFAGCFALPAPLERGRASELAPGCFFGQVQGAITVGGGFQSVAGGAVFGERVFDLGESELGVGHEPLIVERDGALDQGAETLGGELVSAELEAQAAELEQNFALGRAVGTAEFGVGLHRRREGLDRFVFMAEVAHFARVLEAILERLVEELGAFPMARELEDPRVAIGHRFDRFGDDRVQLLECPRASDLRQHELTQDARVEAHAARDLVFVEAAGLDEVLERLLDGVEDFVFAFVLERLFEHADVEARADERGVAEHGLRLFGGEALLGRGQYTLGAIDERARQVREVDALTDRVPSAREAEVVGALLDRFDELGRVRRVSAREVEEVGREVAETAADRLRELEEIGAIEPLERDEFVEVRVAVAPPADELVNAA